MSARARSTSGSSGMCGAYERTAGRCVAAPLRRALAPPRRRGLGSSPRATKRRPPTTELFLGAGLPGPLPGADPLAVPAPPAPPPRARPSPDRSVPPLDALVDGPSPPLAPSVGVPAGVYRVGEPGEERDVALAGVRIGRWPVVCAHVAAFVARTGHPIATPLGARLAAPQLADHPVTGLTFEDALAFCAWAGARLPTGDEWEAAARGPDARPWPWGATFEPERCACVE